MIKIIFDCNKIFEVIIYYYKIFKLVNCLLQHCVYIYIYNCIKILIKIFGVYCNGIFFFLVAYIYYLQKHYIYEFFMNKNIKTLLLYCAC